MRTFRQLKKRFKEYGKIDYIYWPEGYMVWRIGTGDNIEILFIEVSEKRKGMGTKLFKEFLKRINPYHSVFVFHLASRKDAEKFYKSVGFNKSIKCGIYKDDKTVLRWATYEELQNN